MVVQQHCYQVSMKQKMCRILPGHQNRELKPDILVFVLLTNLSIVCSPQILPKIVKNGFVVFYSS